MYNLEIIYEKRHRLDMLLDKVVYRTAQLKKEGKTESEIAADSNIVEWNTMAEKLRTEILEEEKKVSKEIDAI